MVLSKQTQEGLIKDFYRSIKLKGLYGQFINTFYPLKASNTIWLGMTRDVHGIKNLQIIGNTPKNSLCFIDSYLSLRQLWRNAASMNTTITINFLNKICIAYLDFYFKKYYKGKPIIPNPNVYRFYYGTIMSSVGSIIMFGLMLYFLPLGLCLLLLVIMFIVLLGLSIQKNNLT